MQEVDGSYPSMSSFSALESFLSISRFSSSFVSPIRASKPSTLLGLPGIFCSIFLPSHLKALKKKTMSPQCQETWHSRIPVS